MRPKNTHENPDLFRLRLDQFIDMKHELVILANKIDWPAFEKKFGAYYIDKKGRPGAPTRLMVGLHYLKYAFDESDESVVYRFVENPYDGHTLKAALEQVERLTDWSVKEAYVDLGYRGHDYTGGAKVNIVNFRSMAKKTRSVKRWLKRRSAIEPVIGHIKSDNGMARNCLKGAEGDKINALLSGCGFNTRKLLAVFL